VIWARKQDGFGRWDSLGVWVRLSSGGIFGNWRAGFKFLRGFGQKFGGDPAGERDRGPRRQRSRGAPRGRGALG
jgi:hypothetical protein